MADRRPAPAGDGLRWRFRAARLEAAVTDLVTALLIGGTGVAAVLVRVAESRGMLNPGTWAWVVVAGLGVTVGKVALEMADMRRAGAVWRKLLVQSFGADMRADGDAARQARLAIEFRVRLAEAEAAARRGRREVAASVMPRLDEWLALIVALAREVASLRGEARFQAGLASQARTRLAEIEERAARAADPALAERLRATASGIAVQVRAFDAFNAFVDDGYLRLEHAVSVFSAASSQLVLDLSRGRRGEAPGELDNRIGAEIAALEDSLSTLGRLQVPVLATSPEG